MEENKSRLEEVESTLLKQKEILKQNEQSFICEEGGKCFVKNSVRRILKVIFQKASRIKINKTVFIEFLINDEYLFRIYFIFLTKIS